MESNFARKFTDREIELLIQLWHAEPALWDSSKLVYNNPDARKAALMRISEQFDGVDTGVIQLKLRSLRVEFSRGLRQNKKPSGADGSKKKPWRFLESLMFLRDSIIPRYTASNLGSPASSISKDTDDSQTAEKKVSIISDSTSITDQSIPSLPKMPSCTNTIPSKKQKIGKVDDATTTALRRASEVMTSVCRRLVQPTQQQPQQEPNNATRSYCDMLYHQLMAFDEMEREEIQLELQQIVMRHKRNLFASVHDTSRAKHPCVTPASRTSIGSTDRRVESPLIMTCDTYSNSFSPNTPEHYKLVADSVACAHK